MSRCDDFLKQYYGALSFRDYTLLDRSVRTPEAIHEYYDSKTGAALGVNHFGWSCAFIIKFLLDWEEPLLF